MAATDPLLFTAWQLLSGFVALALLAWAWDAPPVRWNLEFAWTLAFSAILATGIGWGLWTDVLARTPAAIAGLTALGIPVVAVIASAMSSNLRIAWDI